MKRHKKLLLILLISALSLFLLYNAVWFAYVNITYKPLEAAVGYDETRDMHIAFDDEGYHYVVFRPDYLLFTGNLSIGKDFNYAENGETFCSVIIWPTYKGYEFGISLRTVISVDENSEGLEFETVSIMLDENGQPLDELSDEEARLFEENQEQIREIYQKAHDMWGIGNIE